MINVYSTYSETRKAFRALCTATGNDTGWNPADDSLENAERFAKRVAVVPLVYSHAIKKSKGETLYIFEEMR